MGAPRTIGWAAVVALLWSGCVRAGFDDLAQPQVVDGDDLSSAEARPDHSTPDATPDAAPDAAPDATHDAAPDTTSADLGACVQELQSLQILSNEDDGEIDYNQAWHKGGENSKSDPPGVYMGYWTDKVAGVTWGYFRFKLTKPIPASASAVIVRLQLHGLVSPVSSAGWDSNTHALRVHVEDSADADPVTSSTKSPGSVGGRPTIAPTVRWPAAGGLTWTTGGYNQLSTLGPPLQALVLKRGGLKSGAYVQIWIRGDFNTGAAEVATHDISRPGYQPAKLTIGWCK